MSGVPKIGIDFAGWNVDIFDKDTKIDKLLCSKGWIGFSIYFFLCMKAYGTEGYFYRFCDDDCASIARRMGCGIREGTVRETVDYCLQISLFDKGRFDEWGILTSRGIQRRYWCVLQKRRVKKVYREFWLLEDTECPGLVKVSFKTDLQDAQGYLQDADAYSQAANKENKVKESKYNNIVDASGKTDAPDARKQKQDRYSDYKPSEFELWCVDYLIKSLLDDLPNQRVPRTEAEKRKWALHIERMQRIDGLSTEQIRDTLVWAMHDGFWRTNIRSTGKFREKFQTLYLQSRRKGGGKKNAFNDFRQNDYDFDRLEQELLSN